MNNVLITGGTGFVGSWMQKTQPKWLRVSYLNHKQYTFTNWYSKEWDYIVHLAPVFPTRVLSHAGRARLLYCSSGAVYYGNNEYAKNKRTWEQECLDSYVDVVIARLFTFYGEGLDEHKAYTQFMKAARQNLPIVITGDGNTIRSYMHGEEMGRWMWAILLRGVSGDAYDVGSDEPITMLELANQIKRETKSQSEIIIKNGTDPMPYYMPKDTAKTKRLLTE